MSGEVGADLTVGGVNPWRQPVASGDAGGGRVVASRVRSTPANAPDDGPLLAAVRAGPN